MASVSNSFDIMSAENLQLRVSVPLEHQLKEQLRKQQRSTCGGGGRGSMLRTPSAACGQQPPARIYNIHKHGKKNAQEPDGFQAAKGTRRGGQGQQPPHQSRLLNAATFEVRAASGAHDGLLPYDGQQAPTLSTLRPGQLRSVAPAPGQLAAASNCGDANRLRSCGSSCRCCPRDHNRYCGR
jgi:hypothetical protein